MSKNIKFEIQIEAPSSRHGWRAIAGRDEYFYLTEDSRVQVKNINTVEEARNSINGIKSYYTREWLKPANLRIVKVEIVTSYEIVE